MPGHRHRLIDLPTLPVVGVAQLELGLAGAQDRSRPPRDALARTDRSPIDPYSIRPPEIDDTHDVAFDLDLELPAAQVRVVDDDVAGSGAAKHFATVKRYRPLAFARRANRDHEVPHESLAEKLTDHA